MKIGDRIAPRAAFGDALVELGGSNPDVVVFDSDVGTSTQTSRFQAAFPDRFYQMGIAEQNMVGAAAGMSTLGFIPWSRPSPFSWPSARSTRSASRWPTPNAT